MQVIVHHIFKLRTMINGYGFISDVERSAILPLQHIDMSELAEGTCNYLQVYLEKYFLLVNCYIILVLSIGLKRYFEVVEVKLTRCPKLAKEPFSLAGNGKKCIKYFSICIKNANVYIYKNTGLHGCETIVSCFTPLNESSQANMTAKWDLKKIIMNRCNDAFIIGGGYAGTPTLPFNGTVCTLLILYA